jgi:predicted RNA-binding protein with TRAM domain
MGLINNYVESRNFEQLRGDSTETSDWSPITENHDISDGATLTSVTGAILNSDDRAIPWGLPSKYLFKDTFSLSDSSSSISIDTSDIALSVDKDSRFGNTDSLEKQWTNMEAESFMVWLQIETFPNFDKRYGSLSTTLKKGETYTIAISQNTDLSNFDVKKYVVFTTTNALGDSPVLGWFFLVASIYVLFFMLPGMIILEYMKATERWWFKPSEN